MRFSSVAFELPYLFIELFFIGVPVMLTDGRSVCSHVITKFSRIGMGKASLLDKILRRIFFFFCLLESVHIGFLKKECRGKKRAHCNKCLFRIIFFLQKFSLFL